MNAILHPKLHENGGPCTIDAPTEPTPLDCWRAPLQAATVVPGGAMPPSLNGVAFDPWRAAPDFDAGWTALACDDAPFAEPEFMPTLGKRVAAGVVIEEPDGRIWVVHPSNGFGGYPVTFPKGRRDAGMPLRATAVREAWEESGLRVVLTGFLCDLERSISRTRYYLGRRIGGCPADMGWESQAVSLVPRAHLLTVLRNPHDVALVAMLPAPRDAAGRQA